MEEKKTAAYKITPDTGGNRYRFYCDVSGALVCITSPYHADTPEEELMLAWEKEGRQHFNQCRKCGRFIIDAVYNPVVFEYGTGHGAFSQCSRVRRPAVFGDLLH